MITKGRADIAGRTDNTQRGRQEQRIYDSRSCYESPQDQQCADSQGRHHRPTAGRTEHTLLRNILRFSHDRSASALRISSFIFDNSSLCSVTFSWCTASGTVTNLPIDEGAAERSTATTSHSLTASSGSCVE